MNLGKTVEENLMEVSFEGNIIKDSIFSKFKKICYQAVLSRLSRILFEFLELCFIRNQQFHFIKVIKFIVDGNSGRFLCQAS